jgi:hypothetical protein
LFSLILVEFHQGGKHLLQNRSGQFIAFTTVLIGKKGLKDITELIHLTLVSENLESNKVVSDMSIKLLTAFLRLDDLR